MYTNQYIVYSHSEKNYLPECWEKKSFQNLTVIHHKKLNCSIYTREDRQVLLLGYILDPFNPDLSNDDIVKYLCESCLDTNKIIEKIQNYSGRFVIFYKNPNSFIALTDACGLRQLFYFTDQNGNIIFSSYPKLMFDFLGIAPLLSSETEKLINSDEFRLNESPWFGNSWIDKRFMKILPNHYLDIDNLTSKRTPLFYKNLDAHNISEYLINFFYGSYRAIRKRYDHLIQPLTAGWDSRILLAASKEMLNEIDYYIFISSYNQLKEPDPLIANRIATNEKMSFKTILTSELKEDFLTEYKNICFYTRISPKTRNIQWHFYNNRHRNVININGNGGEIFRRGYYPIDIDNSYNLTNLFRAININSYFNDEMKQWYEEALPFAKENNLNILEVFYWEQRMGHWGALYPYEQDIAMEEFSPFNNKDFLLTLLQLDVKQRKSNCLICEALIKKMWPQLMREPINPILGINFRKRIQPYIKKYTRTKKIIKKVLFISQDY